MTPSFHSNRPSSFPSYFPGSGTSQELPGISAELIEVHRLYEELLMPELTHPDPMSRHDFAQGQNFVSSLSTSSSLSG